MEIEATDKNRLKTLYPFVDETETPLPSCWNRRDKFPSLSVTEGNLRVRVRGRGGQIPAAIRSDHPIPPACGLYYFEIHIRDKGRQGCITIGLSQENTPLDRMPGWCDGSFGYAAETGKIFAGSESGIDYGPTFTSGDVIGCGINFAENTCFYTKNGQNIGIAFKNVEGTFYVTVGLLTSGETIDANFGRQPFIYNIYEDIEGVQTRVKSSIRNYALPATKSEWLQRLVSDYLVHHGFAATAESFSNDFDAQRAKEAKSRQGILNLVKASRFDDAIGRVQELCPNLFEQKPELLLWMKCQEFFETLVRYLDEQRSHRPLVDNSKPATSGDNVPAVSRLPSSPKCRRSKFQSVSSSQRSSPVRLKSSRPFRRSASPMSSPLVLNGCEKVRSSSPEFFDPSTSVENGTNTAVCDGYTSGHVGNGVHKTTSCEKTVSNDDCAGVGTIFYDASPWLHNGTDGTASDVDGDCPMTDASSGNGIDGCLNLDGNCDDGLVPTMEDSRLESFIAHGRELYEMHTQLEQQNGESALLKKSYQILRDAFDLIVFTNNGFKTSSSQQRRESFVSALNSAMLEAHGCPIKSSLDTLYAHAQRLRTKMAKHGLGAAAFADVDHYLKE